MRTISFDKTVLAALALAGCAATAPLHAPAALAQSEAAMAVPDAAIIALAETIADMTLPELAAALSAGAFTSEQLVQAYMHRIETLDDDPDGPNLNAIIAVMPTALAEARLLDAERAAGNLRGPLHGIPIILKDNIEAAGPVATTAGSTALLGNVTDRDAPLVANLRAAGAVILAKANLSQWANIRSNESVSGWSSVGGLTRNPHALDRNTCGSSSGSGAGTAAGLGGAAVGTETDGSVVCPSSINGIVGFKPTVGLVSRRHIIPISHSQDTAGPMTRSVTGAAMMLTAMAGSDSEDPATADADRFRGDFTAGLEADYLAGVRIGVLFTQTGENAALNVLFQQALADMERAGAELVMIENPREGLDGLGAAEYSVLLTELKADMAAYLQSLPDGLVPHQTLADLIAFNTAHADVELRWFDQDIFDEAEAQPGLDDPAYLEAVATSRRLAGQEGIDRLLRVHEVQFLMAPTTGPAWTSDLVNGDHFVGPSASRLAAVAGYPHITVPMGFVEGLPVGVSLFAGQWQDHAVLRAGYAYEQASQRRRAPGFAASLDLQDGPITTED